MTMKTFFRDLYLDLSLATVALIYIFFNWENNLAHIAGVSLAITSLIPWIVARFHLGRSFAVMPEAKELVTEGVYSKIRNPMYVFSFLTFLGVVIALEIHYLYLVLILLIIMQIYRSKKEEEVLQAKFGQKYLDYKNKTWF